MTRSPTRRTAAVLAAGVVLAATWTGCTSDEGDAVVTTTTAEANAVTETTMPVGTPAGATEQGLRALATGDCFDLIEDPVARDRAVWLIDCALPHSHEVFDVFTYDGEVTGDAYPGAAMVQNWAEQACYDRFEPFVGVRWTLSELDIEVWWPSEESWGRGDRTVVCTVFSPRGDRLTGTQRGIGR